LSLASGGHTYTIITSEGGPAFTLADSGAGGVVSTVYGSVYTVEPNPAGTATNPAASTASSGVHSSSAAYGSPSLGFTVSHAIGIATIIGGTLVGALITL
jgi:hypothetical protein